MPSPRLHHFFFVVAMGLAAIGALSAVPGDEGEVRSYLQDFADACSRAETADVLAGYYADDATHVTARGEWVETRETLAGVFGSSTSFDVERVSFLAERVALVVGSLRLPGQRESARRERFALVLKKTSAGWKIAASRASLPGAP